MIGQVVSLIMPWNGWQNGGGCFGVAAVSEGKEGRKEGGRRLGREWKGRKGGAKSGLDRCSNTSGTGLIVLTLWGHHAWSTRLHLLPSSILCLDDRHSITGMNVYMTKKHTKKHTDHVI